MSTRDMLEAEEYESDALEMDILFYDKYGVCNMKQLIQDDVKFDQIFDYVYDNKCMSAKYVSSNTIIYASLSKQ